MQNDVSEAVKYVTQNSRVALIHLEIDTEFMNGCLIVTDS